MSSSTAAHVSTQGNNTGPVQRKVSQVQSLLPVNSALTTLLSKIDEDPKEGKQDSNCNRKLL